MEAIPGATANIPPPTPDLPGKPTRYANSPEPSYPSRNFVTQIQHQLLFELTLQGF